MLTLANVVDGDGYSDIHKEVYGFRPRNCEWNSQEEFDADFKRLLAEHDDHMEEEKARQAQAWTDFLTLVEETQDLVQGTNRARAVEIIADAEGISEEELIGYNYNSLEYSLGLKFNSIHKWLEEETN